MEKYPGVMVDEEGMQSFAGADAYMQLVQAQPVWDLSDVGRVMRRDPMRKVQDAHRKELEGLFFRASGGQVPLTNAAIHRRLSAYQAAIESIASQLEGNAGGFYTPSEQAETTRTRVKTLSELFSPVAFRGEVPVIDPRRLTWTLMENLGLLEKPARVTEADSVAMFAEKIPELQELLAGMTPIEEEISIDCDPNERVHHRLYIVNSGAARGKLLGVYNRNGENGKTKRPFVISLHNMLHRTTDVNAGHREEVRELYKIQNTLKRLSQRISPKAEDRIETDTAFDQALDKIMHGIELLENVEDQYKKNILRRLLKLKSPEDKRGRRNIPAKMAVLAVIGKDISGRIEDIRGMGPYLRADFQRANALLGQQFECFERLERVLMEHLDDSVIMSQDVLSRDQKDKLAVSLKSYLTDLSSVTMEPYLALSERITSVIESILTDLEKEGDDDIEANAKYGTRAKEMIYLVDLVEFFRRIYRFEDEITDAQRIDITMVNDVLRSIRPMFNRLQFDPSRSDLPDYLIAALRECYRIMRDLNRKVREIYPDKDVTISSEDRGHIYGESKQILEQMDDLYLMLKPNGTAAAA